MDAQTQLIFDSLPNRMQEDINAFLESNPSRCVETHEDLVDAYLTWNGIIGYANVVMKLFPMYAESMKALEQLTLAPAGTSAKLLAYINAQKVLSRKV